MSGGLTPAGAGDARVGLGDGMSLRERLADVARFAVRPTFRAEPMAWGRAAALAWLTVFVLDAVLVAGAFLPVAAWGAEAGFFPEPLDREASAVDEVVDFLIVAPLLEELVFRGWMTGRIAALRFGLYGFAAMGLFLAALFVDGSAATAASLAGVAVAFAGLLHWGLTRERDRAVPAWFTRHFRWIVWGSSVLFGVIHLGNFAPLESPIGLLVILPQTIGGLLLAYTRTRLGLRAAIAHHAAFNAVYLSLSYAW